MLCVSLRLAHLNTAYPGLKLFSPLLCGLLLLLNEADLVVDGVQLLLRRRMQGVNQSISGGLQALEENQQYDLTFLLHHQQRVCSPIKLPTFLLTYQLPFPSVIVLRYLSLHSINYVMD